MTKISVGLLGFGEWPQQAYAPVLNELDHVEVTALAARSETTRTLAADAFGPQLRFHDHWRTLLDDPDIDAVMMALPNALHAEVIEAVLAADKHLLYEPPVGSDQATIERVLAAMASSRRIVQADLELRYLPVIEAVKQLLDSGELGATLMAKIRLWCNWGYGGGPWYEDAQSQNFFLWLGCWYLDVLDCIFAVAPTAASVVGGYASNGSLMDHGWATLTYPQGGIGQYEFNLVATTEARITLHVAAAEGEIEADIKSGDLRYRQSGGPWQQQAAPASAPACGFEGMRESIRGFFDAIAGNSQPKANVEASRRVHQAALACAQATNPGHLTPDP